MANVKLSELPVASSLDGSELVPVVQGAVTRRATAGMLSSLAAAPAVASKTRLAIFYGPPVLVNGVNDVEYAVGVFSNFDHVVLGAGLEEVGNPAHASTVALIGRLPATRFYGYVDVSVTFGNFTMSQLKGKVDLWLAAGVDGIFMDVAGYSYGVSRARLNEIVTYVHSLGMNVVANDDLPDDLFGSAVDATYNPTGAATALGAGDVYLMESWVVNTVSYVTVGNEGWNTLGVMLPKMDKALAYRDSLGIKLWASGVVDWSTFTGPDVELFHAVSEAMYVAYGIDAYTLAPPNYAASGPTANELRLFPHRARPAVNSVPHVNGGTEFLSPGDRRRIQYEVGTHAVFDYFGA